MVTTVDNEIPVKPKKNRGAKAQSGKTAERVKVSLVLSAEVDFRLSVHAAAQRIDRSGLANQILADALKRYRVQDLGGTDRAKSPDLAIGGDTSGN